MKRMITIRERMLVAELQRVERVIQVKQLSGWTLLEKHRTLNYRAKLIEALDMQVRVNNGEFEIYTPRAA